MNKKTTYELTITAKLQQLPLPDLEDAIWARVKTQLDLDMPTDDGDGGDAPDAPSGGGWLWSAGTALFVVALITTFFLTKKPAINVPPAPRTTIETVNFPPTLEQKKEPAPPLPARRNSSPPVASTGSPPLVPDAVTEPLTDAVTAQPTVSLPRPDSTRQTTFVAPPPVVQDSTPLKKKARGVTGITDNDYRIVPKKDST